MSKNATLSESSNKFSVGLLGVRGYVGEELVKIIENHPSLKLSWVSSRSLSGKKLSDIYDTKLELVIDNISPERLQQASLYCENERTIKKNKRTINENLDVDIAVDVIILALPNGAAEPFVEALRKNNQVSVVIDLSADYRFDESWQYALPEIKNLKQGSVVSSSNNSPKWISNPGCYATAMQLAIAPILDLISGRPNCFGISGYSGAGTTPSITNHRVNLQDNIIPYKLVHHLHEKEVGFHLDKKVSFTPHVAEFFRGISMTVQVESNRATSKETLFNRFNDYYALHPFVQCLQRVPTIKEVVHSNYCIIGGFETSKDGKRATIVCCLDNLLKGAASQAIQNLNIALNLSPEAGLNSDLNCFELKQPA